MESLSALAPGSVAGRLLLRGYHPVGRVGSPGARTPAPSRASGERHAITEIQVPEPTATQVDERRAEEVALLARIVERDERAVEELYHRFSGPLYSLAYKVTGSDRFAQDVVQEVFVVVWRDASRFDSARGHVGSWLFSLARHKAIDIVRREANARRRTADVDLEFEEAPDDVHHEAWLRMQRERVREAIGQLSEVQRTALELAFFGGLTHVEVAERLDIPLGTAKTRIRSALLRLRDVLGSSLAETDTVDQEGEP
jgi:RNA polymerase sigma-70 factor (ECF subfamily)